MSAYVAPLTLGLLVALLGAVVACLGARTTATTVPRSRPMSAAPGLCAARVPAIWTVPVCGRLAVPAGPGCDTPAGWILGTVSRDRLADEGPRSRDTGRASEDHAEHRPTAIARTLTAPARGPPSTPVEGCEQHPVPYLPSTASLYLHRPAPREDQLWLSPPLPPLLLPRAAGASVRR